MEVARRFGEVSGEQENAIRSLGYVNKYTYSQAWESIYTATDLERLYELNPLWARIERKVYGGTLLDQYSQCPS